MRIRRKTLIRIATVTALIIAAGYWFFMHTNRGSSLALYAMAGIHAPLDVKIACAKSTDARVREKFQLPLAFTDEAKDALRGFWYYDYFRECLYAHGYDFTGKPIPRSGLSAGTYRNPFVGITFDVTGSSSLMNDNLLNVDFDDHLYTSGIRVGDNTVIIHAYADDSTKQDLDAMTGFSVLTEQVLTRETFTNPAGIPMVRLTGASGISGILFRTPQNWSVYIFDTEAGMPGIDSISQSLTLLP